MGVGGLDAREEGSHDDHEQQTDVAADDLHWVRDVQQGVVRGNHVGREEPSHDESLLDADGVGGFPLGQGDQIASDGAEEAAEPDHDRRVSELGGW